MGCTPAGTVPDPNPEEPKRTEDDFMQKRRVLITSAVSSLLALSIFAAPLANAADADKEKCYGVVKGGKNDCAANGHACAGQSKADNDPKEWISLPKGTCEKLIGGTTKAPQ